MSTSKRFVTKNGLDNNGNSITNLGVSGASVTMAGANALTLTTTGPTNITFPTSGTLATTAGSTTTAINISGGAAGSVPYQSAASTTAFLAAGTASQVLVSGASSPAWTNTPTLTGTNFTGIPNAGLTNSSLTIGSTSISLGGTSTTLAGLTSVTSTTFVGALTGHASLDLALTGGSVSGSITMTGGATVTGLPTPAGGTDAVNKNYVDAAITGLEWKQSAAASTTATLTVTYSNGASGVGATLTNAGAQAAFATDGYTAALNDRILVKNQASAFQNGIYSVTTVGTGATNWVLTRTADANTSTTLNNATLYITNGTTLIDTGWTQITANPTIGTSNIAFNQFSGAGTYVAGTGLSLTGNTFANTGVTSVTGSTNLTTSAATGAITLSLPTTLSGLTSVTSTTFVGALTGHSSLDLALTGGVLSGIVTSTTSETFRTANDSGFISFFNTANNTRQGYLQGNVGAGLTLSAETGNLVENTTGSILLQTSGTTRATVSSTGVAVTGAISSTTGITNTATASANSTLVLTGSGTYSSIITVNAAGGGSGQLQAVGGALVLGAATGQTVQTTIAGSTITTVGSTGLGVTGTISASTSFSGPGTGLTGTAASLNIGGTAPAGSLTGSTLAAGVTASSLTSVGTLGSLSVTGTATAGTFSGAGTNLTGTAASLNIGGNAATATNATNATNATTATRGLTSNSLANSDGTSFLTPTSAIASSGARNVSLAPNTYTQGIFSEFKNAALFGTAGNYSQLVTFANWLGTTASTGDPSYQMLFSPTAANSTSAPNIYVRAGIDTTWGSFAQFLHAANYNNYSPTLTGGGASGTWGINVTGSASSATTATTATNQSGGTVNATTGTFSGKVTINNGSTGAGSSSSLFANGGDITAARASNQGVVYLGTTGSNYIYYDGTNYNLPGGSIISGGFSGPGTSLTGTAGSLSIGGNAATATTATNQSGGTVNATTGNFSGTLAGAAITCSSLVSSGDVTAFSDIRIKRDIEVIPDALSKVEEIRGVTYMRTDDAHFGEFQTGVIAQEVQKVLPEAVRENEDGMLSVAYGNMVGLLIESIKELSAQNKSLLARIEILEGK